MQLYISLLVPNKIFLTKFGLKFVGYNQQKYNTVDDGVGTDKAGVVVDILGVVVDWDVIGVCEEHTLVLASIVMTCNDKS